MPRARPRWVLKLGPLAGSKAASPLTHATTASRPGSPLRLAGLKCHLRGRTRLLLRGALNCDRAAAQAGE
eukprot:scaffold212_cov404-Prasinococcus_capsulatus_cf.AAC.2